MSEHIQESQQEEIQSRKQSDERLPRKQSFLSEDKQSEAENEELLQRKKEDAKSIFVENVDYKTTKEQLEAIFEDCGIIARVTILKDNFSKKPKGCAYVSFEDHNDVEFALHLSGTKLRNRIIKVQRKRTNIAGMSKNTNLADRKMMMMAEIVKKYNSLGGAPLKGVARGKGK